MKRLGLMYSLCLFMLVSYGYAATIRVPQDKARIQIAIDVAADGDTVLVDDGTYTGEGNVNLSFKGKAITVQSVNGPERTIIDCQKASNTRGFNFNSRETAASVLEGFTVRNGSAYDGGGIYCTGSSPAITDCIITGNTAADGGGIYCVSSSSTITDCVITGNTAGDGGGIYCTDSSPTITDCVITGNTVTSWGSGGGIYCGGFLTMANCVITKNTASDDGGGLYLNLTSKPLSNIVNCVISSNAAGSYGGGIDLSGGSLNIINCTITANITTSSGVGGGGIYAGGSLLIKNTILWENKSNFINLDQIYGTIHSITFSNLQGGKGAVKGDITNYENNINSDGTQGVLEGNGDQAGADPLFVDAPHGNYHLSPGSPCIHTGTTDGVPDTDIEGNNRPFGSGVDMGAYEQTDVTPVITEVFPASVPTKGNVLLDIWGDNFGDGMVVTIGNKPAELRMLNRVYVSVVVPAGTGTADIVLTNPSGETGVLKGGLTYSDSDNVSEIPRWDVNEDGIVDISDLALVATHFGETTIPAAIAAMGFSLSNHEQMMRLLAELEARKHELPGALIVIDFLRSLLNSVITQTKLFPNYPNPFNPET